MLRRYLPLLLVILFVLTGCAVFKSTKKKKVEAPHAAQTAQTATPQAEKQKSDTQSPKKYAGWDAQPGDTLSGTPAPVALPKEEKHPEMRFSETESANVRLSSSLNNPFPASGEMEIDLDALREQFCYPYCGKMISPFGPRGRAMHSGMDIKALPNDTIRAAFPGVVRMSKPYSGYGYIVVIRHYNGIETAYAHNSRNLVSVNDKVRAGDPIGLAGRTGRATTEHLHFEFRVASQALNPNLILDPDNQCLRSGTLYLSNRGGRVRASNKPLPSYAAPEETPATASSTSSAGKTAPATSGSQATASKPAASTASASSSSGALYHTIVSGDTLSALARKYGTTVDKICALNGIKPTKILQLKEKIRVK